MNQNRHGATARAIAQTGNRHRATTRRNKTEFQPHLEASLPIRNRKKNRVPTTPERQPPNTKSQKKQSSNHTWTSACQYEIAKNRVPTTPGRQPPNRINRKSKKTDFPTTARRQPPNTKCETDFPRFRAGETQILTSRDAFFCGPAQGKHSVQNPPPAANLNQTSPRQNPSVWPHCLEGKKNTTKWGSSSRRVS